MRTPEGPHTITSQGQVTIPKKVLKTAGLENGDELYFQAQEDGTLLLIPVEVFMQRYLRGMAAEQDDENAVVHPDDRSG